MVERSIKKRTQNIMIVIVFVFFFCTMERLQELLISIEDKSRNCSIESCKNEIDQFNISV